MPLDLQELSWTFRQLANETWFKLERGGEGPTSFGETSITDHNLFMLDMKHPDLNVHHFNQNEQALSGADWEWWIGSDVDGWLCLRIQAKRVRGRSYPELAHPAGDDRFQYDVLIDGCNPLMSEFPLHVLYNGWPHGEFSSGTYWANPATWLACPGHAGADRCVHAKPRDYGCAIVSSLAIKATHEAQTSAKRALNRRVTAHLSNALPWSYLWGIPATRSASAATSLPSSGRPSNWQGPLIDALRIIYTHSRLQGSAQRSESVLDPTEAELGILTALEPDSNRRLKPQLPIYAQAVRVKNRRPGQMLEITSAPARLIVVADFTPSSEL
jgi:hypothetical protein